MKSHPQCRNFTEFTTRVTHLQVQNKNKCNICSLKKTNKMLFECLLCGWLKHSIRENLTARLMHWVNVRKRSNKKNAEVSWFSKKSAAMMKLRAQVQRVQRGQ